VSTYNARFYEGRAVQGTIAGRMTKSNKIGYIGSFPIPEVIMGINSYYLHAKKVNPAVELSVVWAFTWFDPAKEADAAKALIDQGVDVIAAHTDSTAPLAEGQDRGQGDRLRPGLGHGRVQAQPARVLDHRQLGPYYIERWAGLLDGTYEAPIPGRDRRAAKC
jgi:basic membrane protein A